MNFEAPEGTTNPSENKNELSFDNLDLGLLKSAHDRATSKSPDGGAARFGKEFIISLEERSQLESLFSLSAQNFTELASKEPLWERFISLAEERRKKSSHLMTFRKEEEFIIEDPNATDITKTFVEINDQIKMPALKVPPQIRNLFIWQGRLDFANDVLRRDLSGSTKGEMTSEFGSLIYEFYRFNKEIESSKNTQEKTQQGQPASKGTIDEINRRLKNAGGEHFMPNPDDR
ncbi:MAG: hypothetical protein HY093_01250 [Candidatus Liptonbacteria bacterium]|nr:hypothetical protein [Candidatus Liptonbacteria bacterium]